MKDILFKVKTYIGKVRGNRKVSNKQYSNKRNIATIERKS